MNPIDILFQAISDLTGGLIHDLVTVIVAIVCLEFIVLGFEMLLGVINNSIGRRHASNDFYATASDVRASYQDLAAAKGITWTEKHDKRVLARLAEIRVMRAERRYGKSVDDVYQYFGGSTERSYSSSSSRDLVEVFDSSDYDPHVV
jgi:hypothetical protein